MLRFLKMPSGEVVTFKVEGNFVEVTGEGTLSRTDARKCWHDLVELGGKPVEADEVPQLVNPPPATWVEVAKSLVKHGLMSAAEASAVEVAVKAGAL